MLKTPTLRELFNHLMWLLDWDLLTPGFHYHNYTY